jgi:hypothetical protein
MMKPAGSDHDSDARQALTVKNTVSVSESLGSAYRPDTGQRWSENEPAYAWPDNCIGVANNR